MKEKNITNKILMCLKEQPCCLAFKEHGGMYGTAGIPDIICCYKGQFVAFEVKTPNADSYKQAKRASACEKTKRMNQIENANYQRRYSAGKLSKLQEITIQIIKDAKGKAYKVTSLKEVKKILDSLEDPSSFEEILRSDREVMEV